MDEILQPLEIAADAAAAIRDGRLAQAYLAYVGGRVRFLLTRLEKHPDFPGIHMGYHAMSGQEFTNPDVMVYGWINGRAACTLSRFARRYPNERDRLQRHALRAVRWIERYADGGRGRVPFTASLDGRTAFMPCPERTDCRTYSDLYCCLGLLEYGAAFDEARCLATARRIFEETLAALDRDGFLIEPDPAPEHGVSENPWSVAIDLANELAKQLRASAYLDVGARLVRRVLDRYYLAGAGALVEYVTPEGLPVYDAQGRRMVDPGHSIEFCSFALEFSRLAEQAAVHEAERAEVNRICPDLIAWNLARGLNQQHPGIVKSFDLHTGQPIDSRMPWWSLPETMLALLLALERTGDSAFLQRYREVNNAYVRRYLNPRTGYGPYQTLDGDTGQPLDAAPACKFQDPEFHSGKNLLSCIDVFDRIREVDHGRDREHTER